MTHSDVAQTDWLKGRRQLNKRVFLFYIFIFYNSRLIIVDFYMHVFLVHNKVYGEFKIHKRKCYFFVLFYFGACDVIAYKSIPNILNASKSHMHKTK